MSLLSGLLPAGVADLAARFIVLHCGFESFKAIEDEGSEGKAQWLTFWMLFSLMYFMEFLTDAILFWFPFYFELKIMALVYLGYFGGAMKIYDEYVKAFLSKHRADIDDAMTQEGMKNAGRRIMSSLGRPPQKSE